MATHETKYELRTFKIRLHHSPHCWGEYLPTGEMWEGKAPVYPYPHVCNKCGDRITVKGKAYPRIVTEPVNPMYKE